MTPSRGIIKAFKKFPRDDKLIIELFTEGFTAKEIGKLFECSGTTIQNILREHNIKAGDKKYTGPNHPGFNSWEPKIDSGGYKQIRISDNDPLSSMKNADGRVKEHRIVMARHIGRPLTEDETVHHINGDRSDNNIENLELWSSMQPKGQRVEDKLAWAWKMLELYGQEEAYHGEY